EKLQNEYVGVADIVRELRRRHRELFEKQQTRQRELSLIRFEREELDAAELSAGEMKELSQERDRLVHAQALQTFTAGCAARLHDEEGAIGEELGRLLREAHPWEPIDSRIADV